jgi:predicted transcriptional regulator
MSNRTVSLFSGYGCLDLGLIQAGFKIIVSNAKIPLHVLLNILKYFEYVLVKKDGFIHGILVRQDVNKLLGK